MKGMGFWIISGLLGVLLLSAGCPQQQQQRSAQHDEQTAADGTRPAVAALGSPEADAMAGAEPVLPPEWPLRAFPMYPGAVLATSNYNLGGPDSGCVLTLTTTDAGEDVLKFYQEHALAAGFEQQSYVAASESGAAYFTSEEPSFNVGYRIENAETVITLMLINPVPGEQQIAYAGSGQLPPNFPSHILPIFPGATVLSAENNPMDNFLDMHTADATLSEVLSFYMAFYEENGFELIVKDKVGTSLHYVFEHSEGGVVLNANSEPDGTTSIHLIYARL